MKFTVYPAIDIYQGRCVRLTQGDYGARTEYSSNPVEIAESFARAGATWLHVVDLDAAKTGGAENRPVIRQIASVCREQDVSLQVGGGVRSKETVEELLSMGVSRCIIGTAVTRIEWMGRLVESFGAGALVAGLDGRDGKLAVKGWVEQTNLALTDLGKHLFEIGVRTALVTDVARDGTLTGPNLDLAANIQSRSGLEVLASGGIGRVEDVLAACGKNLGGAIVGRALYDGRIELRCLLERVKETESC